MDLLLDIIESIVIFVILGIVMVFVIMLLSKALELLTGNDD